MSKPNRDAFELFVLTNLGDVAVFDNGRYISPKIHNYWLSWQESHRQTIEKIAAYFADLVGPEGAEEIRGLF